MLLLDFITLKKLQYLRSRNASYFKNTQTDGMFFISSSINEIILRGDHVAYQQIKSHFYHSFYSPSKIAEYERWALGNTQNIFCDPKKKVNVIIPAAGNGSRFSAQVGKTKTIH